MSAYASTDRLIASLASAERMRGNQLAETRRLDRAADRLLAELETMNLRGVEGLPETTRTEMIGLFGPLLSRHQRRVLTLAEVGEALEVMFEVLETLQRRRIRFDRVIPSCERKDWSNTGGGRGGTARHSPDP